MNSATMNSNSNEVDMELDKAASRRESNRVAQQKHRQKVKTHEADLERRMAAVGEEKEALENQALQLRQEREDSEQRMRHMATGWEEVRAALQVHDLHRVALCVQAMSFERHSDTRADHSLPNALEKRLEY